MDIFYTAVGLILLISGAEVLVRGACRMASAWGVRPAAIGLTVVAFGTSLPELVTSALANMQGQTGIAIGNVVGSNIANIALILGLSALIRPLKVERLTVRREAFFVVGSALIIWWFALDGLLMRLEAMLLLALFTYFIRECFKPLASENHRQPEKRPHVGAVVREATIVVCGLVLLTIGAKLFVYGALQIAERLGINQVIVGLTVVAIGTSLPELATSVTAAVRRQDDISVGNILGSNVFNSLFVLGICAMLLPATVGGKILTRDIPIMCALSLFALPILRTGFQISRFEGALLVLSYIAYLIWLIHSSSKSILI